MLTKIHFDNFVYLYHNELTINAICAFIKKNILKNDQFILKWNDNGEMISIVRDSDLIECYKQARQQNSKNVKIFLIEKKPNNKNKINIFTKDRDIDKVPHVQQLSPFNAFSTFQRQVSRQQSLTPLFQPKSNYDSDLLTHQLEQFVQSQISIVYEGFDWSHDISIKPISSQSNLDAVFPQPPIIGGIKNVHLKPPSQIYTPQQQPSNEDPDDLYEDALSVNLKFPLQLKKSVSIRADQQLFSQANFDQLSPTSQEPLEQQGQTTSQIHQFQENFPPMSIKQSITQLSKILKPAPMSMKNSTKPFQNQNPSRISSKIQDNPRDYQRANSPFEITYQEDDQNLDCIYYCDICSQKILRSEEQYKCKNCLSFDICAICMRDKRHQEHEQAIYLFKTQVSLPQIEESLDQDQKKQMDQSLNFQLSNSSSLNNPILTKNESQDQESLNNLDDLEKIEQLQRIN